MSREKNFRAWDNDNNEYYKEGRTKHGRWSWFNIRSDGTFVSGIDDCIDEPSHKSRFIVEQFIGIKDRNGVNIGEGDIVKGFWQVDYKSVRIGEVKYWAQFGLYGLEEKGALVSIVWQGCEVIGNIHETESNLPGDLK
jgi:hypothetical protein